MSSKLFDGVIYSHIAKYKRIFVSKLKESYKSFCHILNVYSLLRQHTFLNRLSGPTDCSFNPSERKSSQYITFSSSFVDYGKSSNAACGSLSLLECHILSVHCFIWLSSYLPELVGIVPPKALFNVCLIQEITIFLINWRVVVMANFDFSFSVALVYYFL